MICQLRRRSVYTLIGMTLLALGALWIGPVPSVRAAPVLDVFKSDDFQDGTFLTGLWSEGYVGGDPDGVGNGAHTGSWDPTTDTLYTHWELTGPTLVSSTISDHRSGGDGNVILYRTFDTTNAFLTLKAGQAWDGGDGDYTVDLDFYAQTVTVLYQNNVPVFAESTETFTGDFVGFAGYRLAGEASGALEGQGTSLPPAPPTYPAWEPGGVPMGAWGDVAQVQFLIMPEPATLLLVASGLAGVWLSRRRR